MSGDPSGVPAAELTRGGALARNTAWSVAGHGAPLVAALFAIPVILHGLGTDRFGALSLAWLLIGYVSLFDLGLGRALTKLVAEKLATLLWSCSTSPTVDPGAGNHDPSLDAQAAA